MTVRDVATLLNVYEKTIYRLAQKGDLPDFKVLRSWRFQKEDVGQWIQDRKLIAQSTDKKKLNSRKLLINGKVNQ
jgi:excisionase family DNA binding protein